MDVVWLGAWKRDASYLAGDSSERQSLNASGGAEQKLRASSIFSGEKYSRTPSLLIRQDEFQNTSAHSLHG